jgi:hypothetical protein
MPAEVLAAEFTNGSKRRPATVEIVRIVGGRRVYLETVQVANRREARDVAAYRGAQPWNF